MQHPAGSSGKPKTPSENDARGVKGTKMRFMRNATREELPLYMAAESPQKQKQKGGGGDEPEAKDEGGGKKMAKKGDELKEDMDNLVDEIDAVLEENAEEFVKNYVQRGGE
jgi:ubiquitin-like protein Pup